MVIETEKAAPPAARTLEQYSSSEEFRTEMLNRGLGAKGAEKAAAPVANSNEAHWGDTMLPVPGQFLFVLADFFFRRMLTYAPLAYADVC